VFSANQTAAGNVAKKRPPTVGHRRLAAGGINEQAALKKNNANH
jgi:hypothetical protein